MDCGVQCVVTHGTLGMPQLCADNSDMKDVSLGHDTQLSHNSTTHSYITDCTNKTISLPYYLKSSISMQNRH